VIVEPAGKATREFGLKAMAPAVLPRESQPAQATLDRLLGLPVPV